MASQDPERDDVVAGKRPFSPPTENAEREMFRNAIPVPTPQISAEELEKLKQLEPRRSRPESRPESNLELLATPTEADVTVSPYRYGGRILFKKGDGLTYACSAQFVGEYNILLCAAHCVRDHLTGDFFTDFIFYRAYIVVSYGRKFEVNAWGTKAGWVDSSGARYRYDYAFLRTTTTSDVGHFGYKTFESESSWTAMGYPRNYGNNQRMQEVDGTKGEITGGTVEMLGNPMRSGNSGGAWFIVAGANNRQVMGNDSHHQNTTDEWGPVFTDSTFSLLRAVRDA